MSESKANFVTLDKEDNYSVCVPMKQDVVRILNIKDGLFKLDELNKDISGHFQNLMVYSFNILFFVLHAYPKQKGVD